MLKPTLATVASSACLGGVTAFCLLNSSSWPIVLPLGLALGIIGIVIGNKSSALDSKIEKARVRVVLGTLLVSLTVYLVVGIIASLQQNSNLTILAIIALLPILFPLYYGLSQLLAALFLPVNHMAR